MKIGVNCFLLQPDIGGIRQYFFNLFNILLSQDEENEYVFFHFEHNIDELNRLQSDRWRRNAILLDLPGEIYGHLDKVDLYFCPFSTLSPRPVPMPAVYTIPDIQEAYFPQFFSNYLIVARTYHYEGSSKMADAVITHSDFAKQSLVQFHKIPPEKVLVAYHCVDNMFFRAREIMRQPDKQLPINYIFYPANRWQHKNHDLLLRALVWLRDAKQVHISLVLTGFGKADGYPLKQKAQKLGLTDQIYDLGYVSVEELAYLYLHARMLVFPSLFEGFGIPLVEAMASGCPVAAARTSSLPEIGGDAAAFFDPASPEDLGRLVLELHQNESLRQKLIENGRKRVEMFSQEQLARKHLEAFEHACRSFSIKQYYWHRYFYKYYHAAKMALLPEFYAMLYDIYIRKWNKLKKIVAESMP